MNRYSYVLADPIGFGDPLRLVLITVPLFYFNNYFVNVNGGDSVDPWLAGWGFGQSRAGRTGGPLRAGKLGEISVRPGPKDEKLVRPTDICTAMAAIAGQLARAAIENNGGANAAAVKEFDHLFSQAYMSNNGIGSTLASAYTFSTLNPRPGLGYDFWGQSGFKDEFKEADDSGQISDNIDQTHHFAAYLSAGINGQGLAAVLHSTTDLNNPPDLKLGAAAFEIGTNLGEHPEALAYVSFSVWSGICKNH